MGKHLIIDAFGITNLRLLNDKKKIKDFLTNIPQLVGLTPLKNPVIVRATDKEADGVTGFQLLTTSHASIHTWTTGPKTGQVQIDVFSCKDFDEGIIIEAVEGLFKPEQIDQKAIRRK